jgi:hypothetical protein
MAVAYVWTFDDRYYRMVVDRYYRQLPWPLHFEVLATVLWIIDAVPLLFLFPDLALITRCALLAAAAAVYFWGFPELVRRAIILREWRPSTYGAETVCRMMESGLLIERPGAGQVPWTVYRRAVLFPDGILLVRKGAIRWLPNTALKEGTPSEAAAMVRLRLPVRVIK